MHLIQPNSKLFALIYGASGSGKTHLAATYCQMYKDEPVLLIDADQGSATLNASDLKGHTDNLFVISFDAFKDLDAVFNLCDKNTVEDWVKAIPELKGELKKPFKCVIWDTWSEVQWIMSSQLRKDKKIDGKGLNYRDNMQLQHWGQMTDLNKLAVSSFKAIKMDCIFLMQSEVSTDAVTGQMIKGPAIHGKLTTELPAMFNTVIYTYNDPQGKWHGTTLPKLGWPAKIRGLVGKDMENPKLGDLMK